tara:strand:+ start:396 stop:827 length:432 start_codon:yes stop_codon:yes gene_type:complete
MEAVTEFTPWASLFGGVLIGMAAILLMMFNGRIAGMTGIVSGLIPPFAVDWSWRAAFIIGAIGAPMVFLVSGGTVPFAVPLSNTALVIGGLIVGVGVYFGGGCTSGHGVCGMARVSTRSIAATVIFMITCFMTVYITRHVLGL